jgi:hypothetical protein
MREDSLRPTVGRSIRRGRLGRRLRRFGVVAVGTVTLTVGNLGAAWATSGSGIGSVTAFAHRLTDYVTAIAASVAVLFMAVNGVRYITGAGHPGRQVEAKSGLVAAAVGLAIALSANLLVSLVTGALR